MLALVLPGEERLYYLSFFFLFNPLSKALYVLIYPCKMPLFRLLTKHEKCKQNKPVDFDRLIQYVRQNTISA